MASFISITSFADDTATQKKKNAGGASGSPIVTQTMKALDDVELTDDQKVKVKELATKLQDQIKALRSEGLTPEISKKRADQMKAARDAGNKGKDLASAGEEGFSDAEKALIAKSTEAEAKFRKDVYALLTDAQKEKLPEAAKKAMAPPEKGKGKKKKAE
jgi:Spy/CpxP family protein refolding chaperone